MMHLKTKLVSCVKFSENFTDKVFHMLDSSWGVAYIIGGGELIVYFVIQFSHFLQIHSNI